MRYLRYLPILAFLASCSSLEEETIHAFQIYEEDGITIAETSGIPKYEGELFEYVELLEIQEDDRPESLLNRPTDFLIDSQGYFYVADTGDGRIAVYDANGRYLRSFGRRGDGPGEFQTPRIQAIRGDTVSVFDVRLRRETRFKTDGTLIDITPMPLSHSHRPNEYFHVDDGRMAQIIRQSQYIDNERYEWAEVFIHSTASDTVAIFATNHVLTGFQYPSVDRGMQIQRRGSYLYSPQPIVSFSPVQGFVLSAGDRPNLNIYDTSGNLQKRIWIDIATVQVSKSDKEAVIASIEALLNDADGQSQNMIKEQVKNLRFHEYKPPWVAFLVDDVGFFWLMDIDLMDLEESAKRGMDIMVLDPNGEFLGRTRIPPASYLQFSKGLLLATNLDQEIGEYRLTVYRINPAIEGLEYP